MSHITEQYHKLWSDTLLEYHLPSQAEADHDYTELVHTIDHLLPDTVQEKAVQHINDWIDELGMEAPMFFLPVVYGWQALHDPNYQFKQTPEQST